MAETVAIWLITTFAAANTAGVVVVSMATLQAVTAVVSFIGVMAASMAASKLLAPKMPSFADSSLAERSQMVRSPIASRQIIYGTAKVSGVVVYISTTGTKNEYLHLVVAMAGHEVEEIGNVYFGDELALTGSGSSATGRFAGKAEIYKKLGGDTQTVETNLQAATASLTDGKWTSAHRLRGIAYIYVRLTWDTEVFANGIPNISAIVKGKKVYDPRTTNTVWSANAALCLRDYLTSSAGMGMGSAEIDDTAVQAAANICEEQVQVLPLSPTSYENRYDCNGVLSTSETPDANIGKLLSAMGGLIAYSGGKVVIYAANYRIPTVTLTEKHFAGGMSVQTRTSARDRVNAVKGVYVSEANQWQVSDFPSIAPSAYYTADNNTRYWRDVVLPFTTSSSCAQRLAVIELRRAREEITFSARFRLEAMQVRAGDTVMITNAKLGWSAKVFEVMEWHFVTDGNPPQLGVDMTLRETASSVYDWTVSDEVAVADSPNTTLPNPYAIDAPTNLTLTANGTTQLIQADGTALPRILVSWSAPAEEFIQSGGTVGIEYKESTSTTYLTWSRVPGDTTRDYISSDVKIGLTYDVRIFGESYFKVSTSYLSATTGVSKDTTPPAVPTGLGAVIGTGKAVSLDWNDNTEPDFSEYGVYRLTSAVTASAQKIAETRASRFIDTEVTLGTTYFYWVSAYDSVENQSALCGYVSATPVAITAGSADSTAPSTPSAPTFIDSTAYLSTDGTSFARVSLTAPGLPTGAVALDVLYRRSGASDWIVGNQISSSVSYKVSIDDLSVGIAYEFAARGISFSGALSSVSSTLSQSAPSNTTAPGAPTSLTYIAGNSASFERSPEMIGGVLAYSIRVNWTPPSDKSVLSYEAVNTVTDSDTAANADYALGYFFRQSIPEEIFSNLAISTGYIRVRSVDRTGQKSAWAGGGVNINAYWGLPAGTMTNQNSGSVAITGGSITNITDIAITDGGTGASSASGARTNLGLGGAATLSVGTAAGTVAAGDDSRITGAAQKASNLSDLASASTARSNLGFRAAVSHVEIMTGGAPTEVFYYTHNFGVLQERILVQVSAVAAGALDMTEYLVQHDYGNAGNDANTSYFVISTKSGVNLTSQSVRMTINWLP